MERLADLESMCSWKGSGAEVERMDRGRCGGGVVREIQRVRFL
ncbi:hypothetical protein RSSM_05578 [Rhodopirellula sallentina SM41]|uniref:Uncharacterized protein n=1 Tax=Rhodopirellula sallentina SM41 TaxID=1263870 RepID=M5UAF0_9BACT|nr:hypothetical protein RSSM_05578 [Rhodopirellula sallentina SM41]